MTQRHVIFACLLLSAMSAAACTRKDATADLAAASPVPDACSAALAPGNATTESGRSIAKAQQDARSANSRGALERLGYLYVSRARITNDPGDYTLAERTAACLEAREPGQAAGLLLRGHVLHQLHRFAEAERVARSLVAMRTFPLDYGLLGDALMEQGRLKEAGEAYQKMMDLKPFYQSYTRAAHLRWLTGDVDGAIDVIKLAVKSASPRDKESSAWALTRLASYQLQAGRLDEAARAVESALQYEPDYAAALLVEGRIHLANRQTVTAVDVLRRAARLNPIPEYQWLLADALRIAKLDAEAEAVERELVAGGSTADPRTLAIYLATRRTDLPKALSLAEEELRARADIFTLDAHAWALAANGRVDEADRIMTRALAEGTKDARLFLHAGVIQLAAGRDREARRWLKKAEQMRAMLLPSEALELSRLLTTDTTSEEN